MRDLTPAWFVVALALLAVFAAPASAAAAQWATVNVCDTAAHPNEVGVRAAMPGAARGVSRQIRFRLQWLDGETWRYVATADSEWRRIKKAPQSGWGFELAPPSDTIAFRGVVRYRWRRDGQTIRRALEITEAGHHSTAGADPEDYSAATCSIG
jgi:hypothetical protein